MSYVYVPKGVLLLTDVGGLRLVGSLSQGFVAKIVASTLVGYIIKHNGIQYSVVAADVMHYKPYKQILKELL